MALIKGGDSGIELDIHTSTKAAKVLQYKSDGALVYPAIVGEYITRFEIVPTTVTISTAYWAMRNTGANVCHIKAINMRTGFSGTAAATRSLYELCRFNTATPTGGTAAQILKGKNTYAASSVGDARYAPAGLTVTGLVLEEPLHLTGHANQLNFAGTEHLVFDEGCLVLDPNEGLIIRANTALVAGSFMVGSIRWQER